MFMLRASQYRPGDIRLGRSFVLDPDVARDNARAYIDAIQEFSQKKVGPDDVHVRGLYLTNTQQDYYYSRFTKAALEEQADLIPGAPVMTGHDYSRVPDARFFASRVAELPDATLLPHERFWTECLYYVPKDAVGDAYVTRVDLGVYRECSIGFRCAAAPCSVCSRPIWRCAHMPGELYEGHGVCEYGMEAMTSVLEGSQVFRGGQKDTSNFIPAGEGARARYRSGLIDGDVDARELLIAKQSNLIDRVAEPFGLTVEEFLATDDAQRAIDRGQFFGKRGERNNTQALLLSKSRFATPRAAARWVRDHDFRADKRKDAAGEFIFEQFAESDLESGSARSMPLEEGVSARIGAIKEQGDPSGRLDGRLSGDETVEQWLARTR